jgi:hypothetical protein
VKLLLFGFCRGVAMELMFNDASTYP